MKSDQSMAQSKTKARLNHIAVYVHDLDKSTAFYKDVIGLEMMEEPFKDGLHTWFTLGTQGQLHLIAGARKEMEQFKDRHLCFSVDSVAEFIKKLERYKVPYSDWKGKLSTFNVRPDGIKQIYFQDPDGYWVEINDDNR